MHMPAYILHPPGTPSRAGVLDVGLRCPHTCLFCYYSNMNRGGGLACESFRSGEECQEIVRALARNGIEQVDITGGEPTLHPELVSILITAKRLGLRTRIITLGQNLMNHSSCGTPYINKLIEAGITSFLFSMHAVEESAFRQFTKASLQRLLATMSYLDSLDFQYCINTVIFTGNQHMLPDIARRSAKHGVYSHNFIMFNPYHEWKNNQKTFAIQCNYPEVRPYLEEAVQILDEAGVAVNIRYSPLCAFPTLRKHVVGITGVHLDPHEWRNRAGNYDATPEYCADPLHINDDGVRAIHALRREKMTLNNGLATVAARGQDFKYFPPQCERCSCIDCCDGFDVNYLLQYGSGHASPFAGESQPAPLLQERQAYRKAFLLKGTAKTDMRAIMAQKEFS